MNFTIVLQVLAFLAAHKSDIEEVILSIEKLIPDAPGNSKATAVKTFIAQALNVGDQIDATWPFVAPIFNLLVKMVKMPLAAGVPTVPASPAAPEATGK